MKFRLLGDLGVVSISNGGGTGENLGMAVAIAGDGDTCGCRFPS